MSAAPYTMFTGRCPECHETKVTQGLFGIKERCDNCGVVYMRDPGAWTGATVMAYMVGSVWVVVAAVVIWATGHIRDPGIEWPLVGSTLVVVLASFRYVKRFWMGLLYDWGYVYADEAKPSA